ncbi:MAG TPA: HAF repeat-containing protein [Telluria sp.]|nr:HAF repeat-containing protein [Telluria sp.]
MHRSLLTCVFLFVAAADAAAAARPMGIIPPAGEQTVAFDINAAGQAAVVLEDEDGYQRAVLYQNGKLTELGSLGGKFSDAKAINDRGEIIGSARTDEGKWRAFLFDRTHGMRALGTLGGRSSYGMALNQQGIAVGFADTDNDQWHAFVQTADGEMKDLGTLGGKVSYASGINNHGQVVGTAALPDGWRHAFLYDPAHGMVDLGTLGGRLSSATAINDAGVIVGASETKDRRWHAFVYDGKRMVDLGAKIGYGDSFATDINSAGHVVGTVLVNDERMSFVWRDNKMTVHRGGLGLHLTNSITDKGLVVGATYDKRMDAATMRSSALPVIPRPGNEMILMIGLVLATTGAVVVYRKRYRGIWLLNFNRVE